MAQLKKMARLEIAIRHLLDLSFDPSALRPLLRHSRPLPELDDRYSQLGLPAPGFSQPRKQYAIVRAAQRFA